MSNNVKNYKKGDRKNFMELCFCVGVIPSKTYVLINRNSNSIQHTVKKWVKEGTYEEVKPEKNMKAIIPSKKLRMQMLDKTNQPLPFSPVLYDEFKLRGSHYVYFLNTNPTNSDYVQQVKVRRRRIYLSNESYIFFWGCGINTLPTEKIPFTELSDSNKQPSPVFYSSSEITKLSDDFVSLAALKSNVISTSRMNGLLSLLSGSYAVYNTGNSILKFESAPESKAAIFAEVNARRCFLGDFKGCILLYYPGLKDFPDVSYNYLKPDKKSTLLGTLNISNAYPDKIFAIPLTPEGQNVIKIMNSSYDWEELILSMCLSDDLRKNTELTAFDGYRKEADGTISYYFVYLIPNIERLKKFAAFIKLTSEGGTELKMLFKIFCYPFQEKTLRKYLPDNVLIKVITTEEILKRFGK